MRRKGKTVSNVPQPISLRRLAPTWALLLLLFIWNFVGRDSHWYDLVFWCLIVALLSWYAFFWLTRRVEQRQHERFWRGHCLGCGYDLRGQSDRCPECGRPINPA